MTPEGKVKAQIDKVLGKYEDRLWPHKPVQNGMGKACLDYHNCFYGYYFAIEAKAPGENLTARQAITKSDIEAAGGIVFVIDGEVGLDALRSWLQVREAMCKDCPF